MTGLFARATRGLRRPSLDARRGRSISPPFLGRETSELGGIICSLVRWVQWDQAGCHSSGKKYTRALMEH